MLFPFRSGCLKLLLIAGILAILAITVVLMFVMWRALGFRRLIVCISGLG
jgi:hypothetical protein